MNIPLPRQIPRIAMLLLTSLAAIFGTASRVQSHDRSDGDRPRRDEARTLYIWAGDQARLAPDFLAVIDFDEDSPDYGKVLRTVPIPPPGNVGNEPHHCHLVNDGRILACGGLLSLLRGQNSIFRWARQPAEHRAASPSSILTCS
jgi:hypothetical protein